MLHNWVTDMNYVLLTGLRSTVGSVSDCWSRDCEFEPHPGHITCVEIDHKISSMVILPLQELQLSVTGKSTNL